MQSTLLQSLAEGVLPMKAVWECKWFPWVGNNVFLKLEVVWERKVLQSGVENGKAPLKMKAIGSQALRVECSVFLNDQAIGVSKLDVGSNVSLKAL